MGQKSRFRPLCYAMTAVFLVGLLAACGDNPTATSSPTKNSSATGGPTTNPTFQAILGNAPTPAAPAKFPDSTLPAVKNGTAKLLGPVDVSTPITFGVALKLSPAQIADLQKIADGISDPAQRGKAINNDEFLQKFAPTEAQVQAIQGYMQKSGIELVSVAKNRLSANFKAPASLLQDTFKVKINRYQETRSSDVPPGGATTGGGSQNPPGESEPNQLPTTGAVPNNPPAAKAGGQSKTIEFYANDTDLTLPSNYATFIETVTLNSYPLPSRMSRAAQSSSFQGYTPDQLKVAYNLTPLIKAGMDGSGQTVAVIASGGFKQSDIENYAKTFKLPAPNLEVVLVNGATGKPTDDAGEVTLDIEVVMAMAPKAKILVYETPTPSLANFYDALDAMITDGRTKIINISYGLCELAQDSGVIKAYHSLFAQARAAGITIFISSGDEGAYDCLKVDKSIANKLAVDYPASDPFATAVGGTALLMQKGQYGKELVWGDTEETAGGGGGISSYWRLPDFQKNYLVKNLNPKGARQLPDVSANADSRTGYAVFCTVSRDACGGATNWYVIGGTSASAPLWAGATALIDQYLATKFSGNDPALLIGPDHLYLLQEAYDKKVIKDAPYRDITEGNNLYYKAGQGYDLATGLGTPDFNAIALGIETLYRTSAK